jgi:hypothetical protein
MKKIFFLALLTAFCSVAIAQTPVPNGQLENWYFVTNPVHAGVDYWQPGTDMNDNWITTLNELALVPGSAGGPGPITAERSDDAHSGNYAAKLVSGQMVLGAITIFIPGMLGTATLDMTGVRALLGRANDAKPLHFKGFYKYSPVGQDSATAILVVSKWNASAKKRDTIGFGQIMMKNEVNTYTEFDVPVNYTYPSSAETPDSMTLLTISSGGFSILNFMGCDGEVGSTLYVDDLVLEYPNGIEQQLMPEIFVKAWPNPAKENINFETDKEIRGARIEIFGNQGQILDSKIIDGRSATLPVNRFASGVYNYRLVNGNKIITGGSFTVIK